METEQFVELITVNAKATKITGKIFLPLSEARKQCTGNLGGKCVMDKSNPCNLNAAGECRGKPCIVQEF